MQKKVLALHDLAGLGRSSLVPIISVLSAMGHQCVPLPTAVFSTHMALPGFVWHDLTAEILATVEQYEALEMAFDAVYSGFLSSAAQITSIAQAITRLKAKNGFVLVDPVMADNGKRYKSCTSDLCIRMGDLCRLADLITPNISEAALLLGKAVDTAPQSMQEASDWACALEKMYDAHVVLTGAGDENTVVVLCSHDGQVDAFAHPRIPAYFPGTGDIFASTLLGGLLREEDILSAAKQAAIFVQNCIAYTQQQGTNSLHGVQFEPFLAKLAMRKSPLDK